MSRPTNPGVPAGGPPLPRRQPGQEHPTQPPSWPPQRAPAWPPQPPQQAYAPPPQPAFAPHQAPQQAADPYGAAAYHYPQGQQGDPYPPQPQSAGGPPPRPAGYAPQFERFNGVPNGQPQQQAPQPPRPQVMPRHADQAQDYQQGGYHVPDDSTYTPPRAEQSRTAPPRPMQQPAALPPPPQMQRRAEPQLRGTIADQWPTAAAPRPSALPPQQPSDARGYDLSSYDPQAGVGSLGEPQLQSLRASPGRVGEWSGQAPLPPQMPPDRRFSPPPPEAAMSDYAGQQAHQPAGRAVVAEQEYGHDDIEYEDEPPRRSRGLLIVGALVGAIALGGGLAYGYKMFLGAPSNGKSPPMIKADKTPSKTQPTEPGGKQFPGQTMKVMNGRLTDGSDASAQASSTNEDGVRRVTTQVIAPPGGVSQQAPAIGGPPGAVAMPGVYVVDPLRRAPPQPSQQQQALMAQQPQIALLPPAQPSQAPRTITLPPPRAESPSPPAAPVTPVGKAPARVAVATPANTTEAAPPVVKKPTPRPAAAIPPSGVGAGGGGYVAVLASQRSSTEALAKFADLQQRYSALQGRTPSVQEANLGDKGTYYRLVVPAGAKEQASALCSELKASGHTDCWIKTQ